MEQQSQQSSSYSLYPFERLHSDIHELIFQHFHFSDFLKFSVLSERSFEDSYSSKSCMKRVNVSADALLAMEIESPVSRRPYQNISLIKFKDSSAAAKLLEIMRSLGHRWKCVTITGVEFKDNELVEILKFIESTVEELLLFSCVIKQFCDDGENFTFPRLKVLTLSDCNPIEPGGSERNIELFRQRHRIKQSNARLLGMKILRNCENLKELTLSNWDTYYISTEADLNLIRFNLTKLDILMEPTASFDREGFIRFINRTSHQLKSLSIVGGRVRNNFLETIFRLSQLETLKITRILLDETVKLQVNPSITRLYLVYKHLSPAHQEIILSHTPNLKFLSIHTINSENINIISEKFPRLESLSVAYLWIPHGNFFRNLKHLEIAADIPFLLEQRIRQTPEIQRSPLEKLILNAI